MGAKEAEFSIPFNMATYLLDPKPGPNWYTKEKLTDPELLALAGKVKTVGKTAGLHESFKKFRAGSFPEVTVKIVLKNGKEYSETVRFPKGHPKNRLTFDEGSEMFRRGASFALNAKKTEAAIDRILISRTARRSNFGPLAPQLRTGYAMARKVVYGMPTERSAPSVQYGVAKGVLP